MAAVLRKSGWFVRIFCRGPERTIDQGLSTEPLWSSSWMPLFTKGVFHRRNSPSSPSLSPLCSLSPPPSHSHSLTHSLSSLLSLTPSHTHAHVFLWSTQVEKRVLIKACFICELFARERERERERERKKEGDSG